MIVDSHLHINKVNYLDYIKLINEYQIKLLLNADSIDELSFFKKVFSNELKNNKIKLSFGIHPWFSDKHIDFEKLLSFYENVDVVGEIGMDNEWSNVDLAIQKSVFIKQLKIAEKLEKPIILHTKGMEKEILKIIKNYSMNKLVHWYDDEKYLNKYIDESCYFSINPDYFENEIVKNVAKKVPLDRLLIESDGLDALEWVFKKKFSVIDSYKLMDDTIKEIAKVRDIAYEELKSIMHENYLRFLC